MELIAYTGISLLIDGIVEETVYPVIYVVETIPGHRALASVFDVDDIGRTYIFLAPFE